MKHKLTYTIFKLKAALADCPWSDWVCFVLFDIESEVYLPKENDI